MHRRARARTQPGFREGAEALSHYYIIIIILLYHYMIQPGFRDFRPGHGAMGPAGPRRAGWGVAFSRRAGVAQRRQLIIYSYRLCNMQMTVPRSGTGHRPDRGE